MTQEQRDNLKKLADYLLSGKLAASFNMRYYTGFGAHLEDFKSTCGSVGCAIGHGPYAGIPKEENSWNGYAERVFGVHFTIGGSSSMEYLFSTNWAFYDNTPEGAAKHILYFLENGVPEDFTYNRQKQKS